MTTVTQTDFARNWQDIAANLLKLGATAYGGPAIMGIMQAELQEKRQWVSKERFVEGLSLVNMLPGASAAQLSMFLGYARGGWWGGLLGGLCFVRRSWPPVRFRAINAGTRRGGAPWPPPRGEPDGGQRVSPQGGDVHVRWRPDDDRVHPGTGGHTVSLAHAARVHRRPGARPIHARTDPDGRGVCGLQSSGDRRRGGRCRRRILAFVRHDAGGSSRA